MWISVLAPKLNLTRLTLTKGRPPASASKWQMGFNSAFKGLNYTYVLSNKLKEKRKTTFFLFTTQLGKLTLNFLMNTAFMAAKSFFCSCCYMPPRSASQTHISGHNCIYLHGIYANISLTYINLRL